MGKAIEKNSRATKTMKQYEIRRANLPLPIGRRPVLLLTRSSAHAYLNKVIFSLGKLTGYNAWAFASHPIGNA